MMKTFWIGNGRAVLPGQVVEEGSLLIAQGRIAEVNQPCPPGVPQVDAGGGYILPGLIDIHVHGGGGADFMDATPQAFCTVAQAHCAHGVTALVPTTMTCPDEQLEETIRSFHRAAEAGTGGAELLGLHLEGPYFSQASKGAQPVTEQRIPTREALERVIALGQGKILRWDAAPELPHMALFAQVMREHGILASVAHTQADAEEAMAAFDWGFAHVTHFYNAVTTFHKKNGRVHAGVVEAGYLRDEVTLELIGDGRHIPKESMALAYRIKGPHGICLITDAMRAACTQETHSILGGRAGGVPVVVKDGVAQLADLSSYAGSIATLDQALRVAHLDYGLPLAGVVQMLTLTPARLCGCAGRKGSLAAGKDGDIVIMTPDFQVARVYVAGVEQPRSKQKNHERTH